MTIQADMEDGFVYYTGDTTHRWAVVEHRDATSCVVYFSDGRRAGGEASGDFWHRCAHDWVRYGR